MALRKQKVVVIVGPTSSGKSDLAVKLARQFSGEVISADSRQVYRGLDIGTGKIKKREMMGVPHHLLDVVSPKRVYSATDFVRDARAAIPRIAARGKVPIIAGGTGFYTAALFGEVVLPNIPPNTALRKQLENLPTKKLFKQLEGADPQRAKTIEKDNRRRLIRAIEIVRTLGYVPVPRKEKKKYSVLKIGIAVSDDVLKKKIKKRLEARMRRGMVTEARKLHKRKLSWKRMEELGLEYRYLARYIQGKITKDKMAAQLESAIFRYAKRQKRWWKRDGDIMWYHPNEYVKIEKAIRSFIKLRG